MVEPPIAVSTCDSSPTGHSAQSCYSVKASLSHRSSVCQVDKRHYTTGKYPITFTFERVLFWAVNSVCFPLNPKGLALPIAPTYGNSTCTQPVSENPSGFSDRVQESTCIWDSQVSFQKKNRKLKLEGMKICNPTFSHWCNFNTIFY